MSQDPAPTSASSNAPPAAADLPASYEAAMAELEGLVRRMESADLPLDQLLSGYRRGAQLLDYCHGALQAVEAQIKVLDETGLKAWKPA